MCGFDLVEGAVLGTGRWRVRKLAAETGNAHGDLLVSTGNQVVIRFMAARLLRGKVDHVKEVREKEKPRCYHLCVEQRQSKGTVNTEL